MIIRTINLNSTDTEILGEYQPNDMVLVLCDALQAAFPVTLPDAGSVKDVVFYFKKTDSSANAITLDTYDFQTIDGATTKTIAAENDVKALVSDNNNFYIISQIS